MIYDLKWWGYSHILDNACGFNLDVMPRFRIENQKARTLTVVDLPGIVHTVPIDQDASIIEEVDNMVLKYIRQALLYS